MVHSTCGWTCWWQAKLCDTRAIPEHFRGESLESAVQIYGYFTLLGITTSFSALTLLVESFDP